MADAETPRQARLFGDLPDATATIETDGRVIRPAIAPATAVAEEIKLHVDPSGLSWNVVDSANVCLCRQQVFPAAFDTYEVSESFTVGLHLPEMQRVLRRARKGKATADDVTCEVSAGRVVARIVRGYEIGDVTFADEVLTIDPSEVRAEPDEKDLSFAASATVSRQAFGDIVDWINDSETDHLYLRASGDNLLCGRRNPDADGSDFRASVSVDGVVDMSDSDVREPTTLLSIGYIADIADMLQTAMVDTVTLRWGQEYPLAVDFARESDGTELYSGRFLTAPRLVHDGDSDA